MPQSHQSYNYIVRFKKFADLKIVSENSDFEKRRICSHNRMTHCTMFGDGYFAQ